MAQLIDGKAISQQIKDELKAEVEALKNDGTDICLAVIQVGDDPASSVYVRNKKRACAYIGVESRAYELPEDTTEEQLVELVKELNADDTVNGILVQLPLPAQIDEDKIIRTISADKDVDGFHPESVGRLWIGEKGFLSCTPAGVIQLLKRSGIEIAGKECDHRKKQYCRETNGSTASPGKWNSYGCTLQNEESCRCDKKSRYSDRCNRKRAFHNIRLC